MERDLYDPFAKYLRDAAGEEESRSTVIDTSRARLGKWEAPDIVEIKVTPYPGIGQWDLRLRTFELKREEAWNIDSVLQTAAYGEFAHESWLVVPAGDNMEDWIDYFTPRVVAKANDFGVGLATFDVATGAFKTHMHAQSKWPPLLARQNEWLENILEKLEKIGDKKTEKEIADNIRWARSQADAGRR